MTPSLTLIEIHKIVILKSRSIVILGFLPTSSRYSWSTDHFSHVVAQYIVNDCSFAHGFYFSMSGSFVRMGLGHANTTSATVKHLLEGQNYALLVLIIEMLY